MVMAYLQWRGLQVSRYYWFSVKAVIETNRIKIYELCAKIIIVLLGYWFIDLIKSSVLAHILKMELIKYDNKCGYQKNLS